MPKAFNLDIVECYFFIWNGMLPSMRNFVRPYLNSPHRILQSLLRYHVNFHETTQKLAF